MPRRATRLAEPRKAIEAAALASKLGFGTEGGGLAELAEAQAELARVRAGKRRLRLSEQSSADPIRFINRTPWAFSPSGRWRPGLWSGQSN